MKKNQLLAIDQFAFTDKRKATEQQKSLLQQIQKQARMQDRFTSKKMPNLLSHRSLQSAALLSGPGFSEATTGMMSPTHSKASKVRFSNIDKTPSKLSRAQPK